MPANFPRGFEGKKKVLYVSVVATVNPVAASVISSRFGVSVESPAANRAASAGRRKYLSV